VLSLAVGPLMRVQLKISRLSFLQPQRSLSNVQSPTS
jgi:hypothetical protein